MLRVVGILLLATAGLSACSTAPSIASSNYPGSGSLIGELEVYVDLVIAGGPDASPAQSTLPPGRYAARLDRLQRDQIVLDIDAPDIGDLAVHLREDVGEFPQGDGGFSFTASQHDLPYTIHGEHLVDRSVLGSDRFRESCPIEVLREVCYTASDGESTCSPYLVRINGWRPMEEETIRESEDLALTFVDEGAAAVVARYNAVLEPRIEVRTKSLGACQE